MHLGVRDESLNIRQNDPVLARPDGTIIDGEPKLADFDLARSQANPDVTSRGNLAFMSPEQYANSENCLAPPADIYALGGLLYYLLTGKLALGETVAQVEAFHSTNSTSPPTGVGPELDAVVRRAMARAVEDRYPSAAQIADDLESWLAHRPLLWTSPPAWRRLRLWSIRHPARAVALGALVLGIIGGLWTWRRIVERDHRRELERRWRAARLVGLEKLDVIITHECLDASQINLIRLTTFFHRAGLTAFEKFTACRELMALNPGWTAKDLAKHLHIDASMVTRLLSPSHCIPAWQEALQAGRVGISDAYAASKRSEAEQERLLALKLAGASRDAIEREGRAATSRRPPPQKLARMRITLPHKASLTLQAATLGMAQIVELLETALQEARAAADHSNVATFQRMLRDKAKHTS